MTKDIGDAQCVKQTSFARVTCQTPAATRVTAEANTNGPVMAPKRPDAINAKSAATPNARSEEHTSELQSRLHLVCRLLLEKKKKQNKHRMRRKERTEEDKGAINDITR